MSVGRNREDDHQLAAEYALGLLDADESRAFEIRLAAEPELRDDYAQWAESFVQMVDAVPEEPPRKEVFEQIEAVLFAPARAERWSLTRWLGIGATAVAGLLMLMVWLGPFAEPRADLVAELKAESGALQVSAGYVSAEKVLHVVRATGRPEPGRSFELWLIAGDNPPVSLGVLPESERALIVVPDALAAAMAGGTLAISDEPQGGSPTGVATGPILAVAPLITSS